MNQDMIERLEGSFKSIAHRGPELVDRFYANLFARHPAVRAMFPSDMAGQKQKLLASLVLVVQNLRTPEKLMDPLRDMGARHVEYGTQPDHYPVVRDTLVDVMSQMAGSAWNDQLTQDWKSALDLVSSVMLEGHRACVASGQESK